MAKSRKTIHVDALLDAANRILAEDYPGADELSGRMRRAGVADLMEATLMAAKRYHGFVYLDQGLFEHSKPGIRWTSDGYSFDNTDPTRRRYS